jgi:hypothetical protein
MASVGSGLPSHKSTSVKQLMSNGIKEVAQINEVLRHEHSIGNIDTEKCQAAAFVALCPKFINRRRRKDLVEFTDPGQVIFALQLIDELTERDHNNPSLEAVRAQIYWAFLRFYESVVCAERAVEMFGIGKPFDIRRERSRADLCYFTADAILFDRFVPHETVRSVRSIV